MLLVFPPALHMPVSHLAGSGHQGHPGPHSRKPLLKHYRQHIHLCLCSSWDLPDHQWLGPGGHS